MVEEGREHKVFTWVLIGLAQLAIEAPNRPVTDVATALGWESAAKLSSLGRLLEQADSLEASCALAEAMDSLFLEEVIALVEHDHGFLRKHCSRHCQ